MLVVDRLVVGHAGDAGVDGAAAEVLGGHLLARGGLHQWRAAEEDRAGALHDDRLVAHRRHVGAASGAGAHHRGDLRDALLRHAGLVVEDAAEVVAIGEDVGLHRQERPARVDEVDARQPVLECNLLRPQVLLDGEGVVRAALDRRVVGDDHARSPLDDADTRDDPGRRHDAVVLLPRGEGTELEEGAIRIDEAVDALAGQQLAAAAVLLARGLGAPGCDVCPALGQECDQGAHLRGAGDELRVAAVDVGGENRHLRSREVYGVRPMGRSPVGNG